jgi:hypothetical protein
MAESTTIKIINDLKNELEAHVYLEELRRPNELNDLIMTNVWSIVEKVSRECYDVPLSENIATLTRLLELRKRLKRAQRRKSLSV